MRFMSRGLVGLALGILALGLLALAGGVVQRALEEGAREARPRPAAQERLYAVNVARLAPETLVPVITAYGELASTRELDVRASVGGPLVELAPGFREGGRIARGEVLYRIDPADARAARDAARTDLDDAEAELAEAEAAIALVGDDRAAAEVQRDLRARALARQEDLRGRGVGTTPDLEAAELALSQAQQTLVGRAQAEAQALARVARARIGVARAGIAAAEAQRRLDETSARAPFAGLMSEVAARPGALVGANELLGRLIDPEALEVSFRVTGAEFGRLLGAGGALAAQPVTVVLRLEDVEVRVAGRLDRAGAAVGAGQSGRVVYASLEPDASGLLRPGDFVTVTIEEPALDAVARLPAAAVSPEGRILIVGAEERLAEAPVRVLRREGDSVIVADAPWGAEYVTARAAQLAPGIRVRPLRDPGEAAVALDDGRRAALVAAVEANPALPDAVKAVLIEELQAERVPQSLIDRVDTVTGG
jgi:multidrug efflux pump subunit AcrA (membrane-fusion protein)